VLALLQATWNRCQDDLRTAIGAAVHEAWIADLRPLALERGVVHLEAPNRMACERVRKLYAEVIAASLSKEIGTRVSVEVEPSPGSLLPDELEVGPTRPVVDASNRTAFLALTALLERQPLPASLFVFHGPAGAGKSFLLDWWRGGLGDRHMHFTGPALALAFQAALRDRRVAGLREELSRPRALVLDELHRIGAHKRLQAELCRVLEVRRGLAEPTVCASRWHPREIWNLEPGLSTWLLSGFVARIDPPSPAGRLAYLRALEGAASRNGRASSIEDLARRVQGGYPDLRRAWALERDGGRVHRRSFDLIEPQSAFARLCARVQQRFEIDAAELCGKSQRRITSRARKILAWLCVQEGLSRAEIGRCLGRRTRAAISYSIKALEAEMASDAELRRLVESLR
jgi:chromosomal replication initiation ATPase DnaA